MSVSQTTTRLGVAGDGQLARMMAQAATSLDIEVIVYGASLQSPAGQLVKEMIAAGYQDRDAWAIFANTVQAVTAEWENVPVSMLQYMEKSVPVYPSPRCFEISSNRRLEKEFAAGLGITTAPYLNITADTVLDSETVAPYLPGILKTCSGGYDSLGQTSVNSLPELEAARAKKSTSYVLEKRLDFAYEVSVIGVRSIMGEIALYPAVRNTHEHGILRHTVFGETSRGNVAIPRIVREEASDMIRVILDELQYVGVLAVEMFVMPGGKLIFNEMAPRVHNSGHWTIEGCKTSQFANHVLAVCGRPLGSTEPMCRGAIMTNVLGDEILPYRQGQGDMFGGGVFHDYGKVDVKPRRKMGHVTITYF